MYLKYKNSSIKPIVYLKFKTPSITPHLIYRNPSTTPLPEIQTPVNYTSTWNNGYHLYTLQKTRKCTSPTTQHSVSITGTSNSRSDYNVSHYTVWNIILCLPLEGIRIHKQRIRQKHDSLDKVKMKSIQILVYYSFFYEFRPHSKLYNICIFKTWSNSLKAFTCHSYGFLIHIIINNGTKLWPFRVKMFDICVKGLKETFSLMYNFTLNSFIQLPAQRAHKFRETLTLCL